MARIAALRQVEEFTTTLHKTRRAIYLCAVALVLFAIVCVALFASLVDVLAFYSAGAVTMLIYLATSCIEYLREEKRAARAYWIYLDTYSYPVLLRQLSAARLSVWSRYEINRYLTAANLT